MRKEYNTSELVNYIVNLTSIVAEMDPVVARKFVESLEQIAATLDKLQPFSDLSRFEIDSD
jgi:hypothetical protein